MLVVDRLKPFDRYVCYQSHVSLRHHSSTLCPWFRPPSQSIDNAVFYCPLRLLATTSLIPAGAGPRDAVSHSLTRCPPVMSNFPPSLFDRSQNSCPASWPYNGVFASGTRDPPKYICYSFMSIGAKYSDNKGHNISHQIGPGPCALKETELRI